MGAKYFDIVSYNMQKQKKNQTIVPGLESAVESVINARKK